MADDEEAANPFAIPDFWQSSTWLEQSGLNAHRNKPLFSLDVSRERLHLPAHHVGEVLTVY